MKLEPLHHFQIINYIEWAPFGIDMSISNSVLWMWLATAFAFLFFRIAFRNPSMVPGRMQLLAEVVFLFVRDLVEKNIAKDGLRYFPILFTLFLFILFCNLIGLLPVKISIRRCNLIQMIQIYIIGGRFFGCF